MMKINRRNFMAGSVAVAGTACFGQPVAKSGKIRLAAVGVLGKGYSDWKTMLDSGLVEIVAFCDCDRKAQEVLAQRVKEGSLKLDLAKIPFYDDYRKLHADAKKLGIEAMTVSTPDHTHAAIAIPAMKQGIHCYVQKPHVRTLWELDYFDKTARENKVVVQMGNQGSSTPGMRRGVEILRSGIIGEVREVHVWTNRPVWPQGPIASECALGAADPIPSTLNWDAWLGPAKERAYKGAYPKGKKGYDPWNICNNVYHHFAWRGFTDFGCGAFGDMACHTMNLPFRGLELGRVMDAECIKINGASDTAYPLSSIVRLTYAARKSRFRDAELPAVALYWYDGRLKPDAKIMPQVVDSFGEVPETGCLIVGSKGILCSTNDYGAESFVALNGEKKVKSMRKHPACKEVKESIVRFPHRRDESGHYLEFLHAIRKTTPVIEEVNSRCYSDVNFTTPLVEGVLVGCIAQRVKGKIKWDADARKFDSAAANALIRPNLRKGFEF